MRLSRFQEMVRSHPWYKKVALKLTEGEFDLCVGFIEDNARDSAADWTKKVNGLFLDSDSKPKHHGEICDLLIALKDLI